MNFLFKNEVIDYDFFNNMSENTVLFLHGWGGNKFSFQQTINLIKGKFNVLSVTLPTISKTTSIWNIFDYSQLVENILTLNSIFNPIIICHSFGFRIAMLLNKKIKISKIVVTGGAGLKRKNIFIKIIKNNNKIVLSKKKNQHLFHKVASKDYLNLPPQNRKTFQNIVNFDLSFFMKFSCPMLLFWGSKDKDTKLWIAKAIKKQNNAILVKTKSDHFAYLKESVKFNHNVLKFINNG